MDDAKRVDRDWRFIYYVMNFKKDSSVMSWTILQTEYLRGIHLTLHRLQPLCEMGIPKAEKPEIGADYIATTLCED